MPCGILREIRTKNRSTEFFNKMLGTRLFIEEFCRFFPGSRLRAEMRKVELFKASRSGDRISHILRKLRFFGKARKPIICAVHFKGEFNQL